MTVVQQYRPLTTIFTGESGKIGNYREFSPYVQLKNHILCYWVWDRSSLSTISDHYHMIILPDGCIDIIFDIGSGQNSSHASIAGVINHRLDLTGNTCHYLIGVRFLPGAAYHVLRDDVQQYTGQSVDLKSVMGKLGGNIEFEINNANGLQEKLHVLNQVLFKLFSTASEMSRPVNGALKRMLASHGTVGICDLALEFSLSRRHLSREILRYTGHSPKRLARILRTQAALTLPGLDWGYVDDSHLSKDVKDLTGFTPGQIKMHKNAMSQINNESLLSS